MDEVDEELDEMLRAERRLKMAALKQEMGRGVDRQSVTSAPSVKHVDEYLEELSAAEKRKRLSEAAGAETGQGTRKPQFYVQTTSTMPRVSTESF